MRVNKGDTIEVRIGTKTIDKAGAIYSKDEIENRRKAKNRGRAMLYRKKRRGINA